MPVARILIICPVTGALVPIGIETIGGPGFRSLVPTSGTLTECDACRRRHEWWRAETYLEGRVPRRARADHV